MYLCRGTIVISAIAMLLISAAAPVGAEPGDSASDPFPLASSLPQAVFVDTTGATADPEDPSQTCPGFPPGELRLAATTFFSYSAATDTVLVAEARSPGGTAPHASVYTYESSGALVQWGCSTGSSDRLVLPAGQTYLIMMGTCCEPQGVSGGLAELSLTEQPPPLEIDVRVTKAVVEMESGRVRVDGIVTCNAAPIRAVEVSGGELRQERANKPVVVAHFEDGFVCDPAAPTPWVLAIVPTSGAFHVGKAHLTFSWRGFDNFTTDSGLVDARVHLTPAHF